MDYTKLKEVEADLAKLWDGGGEFESLLGFMRENGLDQTDSFLILERVTGVDRTRAQQITFRSKTWAGRLEVNIQLQKDLIQAIKELNKEDPNFKISFEFEPEPEDNGATENGM
jgi:hypothetical protein